MVKLFSEIIFRHRHLKFGGAIKLIACIEVQVVIEKILNHLNKKNNEIVKILIPESRAPTQARLSE